jgi:hypothetical protein
MQVTSNLFHLKLFRFYEFIGEFSTDNRYDKIISI